MSSFGETTAKINPIVTTDMSLPASTVLRHTADIAKVLVSEQALAKRCVELGDEVTRAFTAAGADQVAIVCITNGSIIFTADLMRHIDMPVMLDCIRVSSYEDRTQSVAEPEIVDRIRIDIARRDVLLVDDILDTGKTLSKIIGVLKDLQPRSLKTCVLLDKRERRETPVEADFVGFSIPNEFVVGYGLDFAERYRNLPCIGVLRPELQHRPQWR